MAIADLESREGALSRLTNHNGRFPDHLNLGSIPEDGGGKDRYQFIQSRLPPNTKLQFFGAFAFVLILITCPSQTSANPTPSLCHIFGISCLFTQKIEPAVLIKTASELRDPSRDFNFSDPTNWSPAFYPQGLSQGVIGIQPEGDSVYAAGVFGHADSVATWGLALWDGRKWSSPLTKPPFQVRWFNQILKTNGKIYFSGDYSQVMPESRFLAAWNGRDWETRPLPFLDVILSMTPWDGKMVLATFMDGLWLAEDSLVTPFQPKLEGYIQGVAAQGGKLWVRGRLKVPGDTTVHGVAILENGAWKVPNPIQSRAGLDWAWLGQEAFIIDGNHFLHPNLDPTVMLRWNGVEWSRVSVDASAGLPRLLASDGKDLYLVGTDRVGVDKYSIVEEGLRISKWDGQKFVLVNEAPFRGRIIQAKAIDGSLIVGGVFQNIGNVRADNMARWDGKEWTPYSLQLRPGLAVPGSAAISWGDKLIFAGDGITMAGKIPVSNIAALGETGWSALGNGIRPGEKISPSYFIPDLAVEITSLAAQTGRLYAAGKFDTAGNRFVRNIAQWDGGEWSPMGEGLPFEAVEILANGSEVYALGEIRDTLQGGGASWVRNVVHWNGSAWNSLGSLRTGNCWNCMAHFNGALWVSSEDSLAEWNGTGWKSLNLGLKGINSLFAHKNALYLSDNSQKLHKYEGSVLDTLPNIVYSDKFASDGENLFVSGTFDLPGSPNTTLARWNGMGWIPMAELSTSLEQMVVHGDYLYLIMQRPAIQPAGYHYYLRWNRKTGTWNQAVKMAAGREKSLWKVFPCVRNCFLSERAANRGMFDVQGRNLEAGPGAAGPSGIRVLKPGK